MRRAAILALLLWAVMATAQVVEHTFVYEADQDHEGVALAGTFNGWDMGADPMQLVPGTRTWRITVSLEPGKHLYKFVLDGEEWITDPNSYRDEGDGNGFINSVLIVWPEGYDEPANVGDGRVTDEAMRHSQEMPLLNFDRGKLNVAFRLRPNDAERVWVETDRGDNVPMEAYGADELYVNHAAVIDWDGESPIRYRFAISDGAAEWRYGPLGLLLGDNEENWFSLTSETYQHFAPPTWVEGSVIYQIFPDRFANGNPANDPEDVQPWDGEPTWYNFFGGDFDGVSQNLDYLDSLGVDTIYFNPIFQGPSNHRYEATDYRLIDERLGTNEQFAEMTREMNSRGINVVLDGVFNHSAIDWAPFVDVVENGEDSEYVDWFFIKHFPVEPGNPEHYECWFGFPSMPKVNLDNPEAKAYMLDMVSFWDQNAEIAGWRLDVANEVSMEFWREFRDHLKGLDEDYWIVGEVWGDGSPWLKGDQWDSVMNYRFRHATLDLLAHETITPSRYLETLWRIHTDYGPQVSRNMMNLLGSHDTQRFMTEVEGDLDKAMMGATLQFAWVGAPSIYYGDELGMEGGPDPDNRRGMRWDLVSPDNAVLKHYRTLIATRDNSPALQSGDPVVLMTDDESGTFAYARVLSDDVAILVANSSDAGRTVDLPVSAVEDLPQFAVLVDVLTGQRYPVQNGLSVQLGRFGATLLVPESVYMNIPEQSLSNSNNHLLGTSIPSSSDRNQTIRK